MPAPAERELLLRRLIEAESWESAAKLARELLADAPGDAAAQRAAGQCALHLNQPDAAERHLAEALRLAPEDDLAHYFYAHALRLGKRAREAEAEVRRAIELSPEEADYWIELGWLAFERGDAAAAQRCSGKAIEFEPHNARAATLRAAAESQLPAAQGGARGDPQSQIAALHRTLELDPENDAALHNIGVVYFNELGDFHSAERFFRRALAFQPNEPLYHKNLARALRRQDPVLRALYAPWQAVVAVLEFFAWAWRRRWPLLVALPLSPFLLVGAATIFVFWAVFLWPPAAFYQYLTLSDVASNAGRLGGHRLGRTGRRPLAWLGRGAPHRWPKTARLALFLAAFTSFWLALIGAFRALAFRHAMLYALSALLAIWIAVCIYACARELAASQGRKRRQRDIDLLGGN